MDSKTSEQERLDALPLGAPLRDYTIEAVLGRGGFGIVYRARHNELDNLVAIKEYLPVELAVRQGGEVRVRGTESREAYADGLRRFRDEARALIEFQAHPSIVSCREFFRANGTAYLVMEHEDGLPLSELLRRREASGRPFDEADLLAVMVPLLEGLERIHEAGMLHRDIKPSNILVRRSDERPVLIDFGAAKQSFAERSKSLAPHTEGYAAWEQVGEGELGPWTDVHAAGAVMWRIVAGGNPPWEPPHPLKVEKRANAALRGEADPMPSARKLGAGRFSPEVLEAIDRCLKLNEKERLRGCGELLGLLRGEDEPVLPAAPQDRRVRKPRAVPVAAGTRFRDCAEGPEMVVIPAGSFLRGSWYKGPLHRATIAEPFAAGIYPVTFEEWDACAADGGCDGYRPGDKGWGRGRQPVIKVSWEDAQAYVQWLSRKTGEEYRLLSEAEWEYAARAGTTTRYSFGNSISRKQAHYGFWFSGKPTPVGSYPPNGYGLYDMHGNVWEWVQDCWNGSYSQAPTDGSAWERGDCSRRVLRGGSWNSSSRNLRSAYRSRNQAGRHYINVGFRVARTLAP